VEATHFAQIAAARQHDFMTVCETAWQNIAAAVFRLPSNECASRSKHPQFLMAGRTTILIVEDEAADAYFLEKAFERILANCAVHRVCDGEEAKAYLQGAGKFADRREFPLPSVILLDLKMPRMNGFEFLGWLRNDPNLKIIPTVVYSSSENPADVRKAYEVGANSFLHKRLSMNAVQETMRSFARYWLEDCGRPPLE
jgi:CheY-like chemotaxis protein